MSSDDPRDARNPVSLDYRDRDDVRCPVCRGKGSVSYAGDVDDPGTHAGEVTCVFCNGEGVVSRSRANLRRLRSLRIVLTAIAVLVFGVLATLTYGVHGLTFATVLAVLAWVIWRLVEDRYP